MSFFNFFFSRRTHRSCKSFAISCLSQVWRRETVNESPPTVARCARGPANSRLDALSSRALSGGDRHLQALASRKPGIACPQCLRGDVLLQAVQCACRRERTALAAGAHQSVVRVCSGPHPAQSSRVPQRRRRAADPRASGRRDPRGAPQPRHPQPATRYVCE